MENHRASKAAVAPTGFINFGSTCFVNAVLQCVLHCPAVADLIKQHGPRLSHVHSHHKFCMICELWKYQRCASQTSRSLRTQAISPVDLVKNLQYLIPGWRIGLQEDAHEFLLKLLEGLNESLPKVGNRFASPNSESVIEKKLQILLEQSTTCRICGTTYSVVEKATHLQLSGEANSITDSLIMLQKMESLCGENRYYCNNCKELTDARQELSLRMTPDVLVLHIKRFQYTASGPQKLKSSIKCQLEIQVKEACGMMSTYGLQSMVVHQGSGLHSGHYIGVVNTGEHWYTASDTQVTTTSASSVELMEGYILFYRRIARVSILENMSDKRGRTSVIQDQSRDNQLCNIDECCIGNGDTNPVSVQLGTIEVRQNDLKALSNGEWLNDQVIIAYMHLIKEMAKKMNRTVHVFDSHFTRKLITGGYSSVKQWTKKINIFKFNILIVLINICNSHWTHMVVDIDNNKVEYYDSLGGSGETYINAIRDYLSAEYMQRTSESFMWADWNFICKQDIPKQTNSVDCGVFTCQYALCRVLGLPINFAQSDMVRIRERMLLEITESCIRSDIADEKSLSLCSQGAKATNTTSILDKERNKQVCVPNVTELCTEAMEQFIVNNSKHPVVTATKRLFLPSNPKNISNPAPLLTPHSHCSEGSNLSHPQILSSSPDKSLSLYISPKSNCEVVQPCLSPSLSHKGSKHTLVSLSPSAPKGSNVMFMSPSSTLEDCEQTLPSLSPASNAMLSLTSQSPSHSPKHSKLSLLSLSSSVTLKHSNQALPSPSLSRCENGSVAFATRPCDPRTINSKQQIDLSTHDEHNAKHTSQNSVFTLSSTSPIWNNSITERSPPKMRSQLRKELHAEVSSDTDFEDTPPRKKCRKFRKFSKHSPDHIINNFLPPNYEYKIMESTLISQEPLNFDSHFRVKLNSLDEGKQWIRAYNSYSKTTMVIETSKRMGGKNVSHKVYLRCQHRQRKQELLPRNAHRNKNTNCEAKMQLSVISPTSTYAREQLESYLIDVILSYKHNHPIHAADVLRFRPISDQVTERYHELFAQGHSPSTAHFEYETQLLLTSESTETVADRATNPKVKDVYNMYQRWVKQNLGARNGKEMFEELEKRVARYNKENKCLGGEALIKRYEKKLDGKESPLILAICTPLMHRVHTHIRQAGELNFIDSSASFDDYNNPVFVVSTSSPAGGLPLGVIVTSAESKASVMEGMKALQSVIPINGFGGKGNTVGPDVILTDDSTAEREGLREVWPNSILLLCIFHFLQSTWRWLCSGQNQIAKNDRQILMTLVRQIVYSSSPAEVQMMYLRLEANVTACKYPIFLTYMKQNYTRVAEWSIGHRTTLLLRGNHTNNYAESGIRILKDMVFQRIKAYNLVQIFEFITTTFEMYYELRLLSVAHNRLDRYIALRFRGLGTHNYVHEDHIQHLRGCTYLVKSSTAIAEDDYDVLEPNLDWYEVNMEKGTCTCTIGLTGHPTGEPCKHQNAVAKKYNLDSPNSIPTHSNHGRYIYAILAVGRERAGDASFYADLHQANPLTSISTCASASPQLQMQQTNGMHNESSRLERSIAGSSNEENDICDEGNELELLSEMHEQFHSDVKVRIQSLDTAFISGLQKFYAKYFQLVHEAEPRMSATPNLARYFHTIMSGDKALKKTVFKMKASNKHICVQPTALQRRRKYLTRGSKKAPQGRPVLFSTPDPHLLLKRAKKQRKRSRKLIENQRMNQMNFNKH